MNRGFQISRTAAPLSANAASTVALIGNDYALRCRPHIIEHGDLRGSSNTSEFLERLYQHCKARLPEVADPDPAIATLDQLLVLQFGWDGRRAPAPSKEAIRIGRAALKVARKMQLTQVRVSPDVEGGVALYFFGGERQSDGGWSRQGAILTSNEGEASIYLRDRSKKGATVNELTPDEHSLEVAVSQISDFLVGK